MLNVVLDVVLFTAGQQCVQCVNSWTRAQCNGTIHVTMYGRGAAGCGQVLTRTCFIMEPKAASHSPHPLTVCVCVAGILSARVLTSAW